MSSLRAAGHVAALKPLVRAAAEDGADVRVIVEDAGAAAYAGIATSIVALPPMSTALEEASERAWGGAAAQQDRGDLEGANEIAVRDGFGAVHARRALPTVREQLADFHPDLVLADPFEPAAALATADLDVPLVLASWSVSSWLPGWMAVLLEGAADATGLDPTAALQKAARATRCSPLPVSLDEPVSGGWSPPFRWHPSPSMPRRRRGNGSRPRFYATLGSVVGGIPPLANRFLAALGPAVRSVGGDCIVTIGRHAAVEPLQIPASVEVEHFLAHDDVMPNVDAVISHGGVNTVLDAAACGVPQLVLPMQSSDQHVTAARLAASGAGIGLPPDRQTPGDVSAALRTILDDGSIHRRAAEVADEMARQPHAATAWRSVVSEVFD